MYCMLRRHIILLIVIRPSDGTLSLAAPLVLFESRHRVSPSPFLSSSHTKQLHYANSCTYSHPNLNFLEYTIQILIPHVMWSVQAVRELKIHHTQRHLSALSGIRSTQVQWVYIRTHTFNLKKREAQNFSTQERQAYVLFR